MNSPHKMPKFVNVFKQRIQIVKVSMNRWTHNALSPKITTLVSADRCQLLFVPLPIVMRLFTSGCGYGPSLVTCGKYFSLINRWENHLGNILNFSGQKFVEALFWGQVKVLKQSIGYLDLDLERSLDPPLERDFDLERDLDLERSLRLLGLDLDLNNIH